MRTETRPVLSAFERIGTGNRAASLPAVIAPKPLADASAQKPDNGCPDWLWNLLMDGISKLLMLRLEGAPPEDAVEGTALVWVEAIYYGQIVDEATDAERLREGFRLLLREVERWPAPKTFLNKVPPRKAFIAAGPPMMAAEREAGQEGVRLLRSLLALRQWLQDHADRQSSVIDAHLAGVRLAMRDKLERDRLYRDPGSGK